ncbi:hypothetical protein HDU86_001880 [Geranomyces michiganensis]|nr:hypothetical protein HDU86_001880 [Geranomyces michiganensis]
MSQFQIVPPPAAGLGVSRVHSQNLKHILRSALQQLHLDVPSQRDSRLPSAGSAAERGEDIHLLAGEALKALLSLTTQNNNPNSDSWGGIRRLAIPAGRFRLMWKCAAEILRTPLPYRVDLSADDEDIVLGSVRLRSEDVSNSGSAAADGGLLLPSSLGEQEKDEENEDEDGPARRAAGVDSARRMLKFLAQMSAVESTLVGYERSAFVTLSPVGISIIYRYLKKSPELLEEMTFYYLRFGMYEDAYNRLQGYISSYPYNENARLVGYAGLVCYMLWKQEATRVVDHADREDEGFFGSQTWGSSQQSYSSSYGWSQQSVSGNVDAPTVQPEGDLASRHYSNAIQHFELSLFLDPSSDMILFHYLKLMLAAGDVAAATAKISKFIIENPSNPNGYRYFLTLHNTTSRVSSETWIPYAYKLLELDPVSDERVALKPLVAFFEAEYAAVNNIEACHTIVDVLATRLDHGDGEVWMWRALGENLARLRKAEAPFQNDVWVERENWWPSLHFGPAADEPRTEAPSAETEELVLCKAICAFLLFPNRYQGLSYLRSFGLSRENLRPSSQDLLSYLEIPLDVLFDESRPTPELAIFANLRPLQSQEAGSGPPEDFLAFWDQDAEDVCGMIELAKNADLDAAESSARPPRKAKRKISYLDKPGGLDDEAASDDDFTPTAGSPEVTENPSLRRGRKRKIQPAAVGEKEVVDKADAGGVFTSATPKRGVSALTVAKRVKSRKRDAGPAHSVGGAADAEEDVPPPELPPVLEEPVQQPDAENISASKTRKLVSSRKRKAGPVSAVNDAANADNDVAPTLGSPPVLEERVQQLDAEDISASATPKRVSNRKQKIQPASEELVDEPHEEGVSASMAQNRVITRKRKTGPVTTPKRTLVPTVADHASDADDDATPRPARKAKTQVGAGVAPPDASPPRPPPALTRMTRSATKAANSAIPRTNVLTDAPRVAEPISASAEPAPVEDTPRVMRKRKTDETTPAAAEAPPVKRTRRDTTSRAVAAGKTTPAKMKTVTAKAQVAADSNVDAVFMDVESTEARRLEEESLALRTPTPKPAAKSKRVVASRTAVLTGTAAAIAGGNEDNVNHEAESPAPTTTRPKRAAALRKSLSSPALGARDQQQGEESLAAADDSLSAAAANKRRAAPSRTPTVFVRHAEDDEQSLRGTLETPATTVGKKKPASKAVVPEPPTPVTRVTATQTSTASRPKAPAGGASEIGHSHAQRPMDGNEELLTTPTPASSIVSARKTVAKGSLPKCPSSPNKAFVTVPTSSQGEAAIGSVNSPLDKEDRAKDAPRSATTPKSSKSKSTSAGPKETPKPATTRQVTKSAAKAQTGPKVPSEIAQKGATEDAATSSVLPDADLLAAMKIAPKVTPKARVKTSNSVSKAAPQSAPKATSEASRPNAEPSAEQETAPKAAVRAASKFPTKAVPKPATSTANLKATPKTTPKAIPKATLKAVTKSQANADLSAASEEAYSAGASKATPGSAKTPKTTAKAMPKSTPKVSANVTPKAGLRGEPESGAEAGAEAGLTSKPKVTAKRASKSVPKAMADPTLSASASTSVVRVNSKATLKAPAEATPKAGPDGTPESVPRGRGSMSKPISKVTPKEASNVALEPRPDATPRTLTPKAPSKATPKVALKTPSKAPSNAGLITMPNAGTGGGRGPASKAVSSSAVPKPPKGAPNAEPKEARLKTVSSTTKSVPKGTPKMTTKALTKATPKAALKGAPKAVSGEAAPNSKAATSTPKAALKATPEVTSKPTAQATSKAALNGRPKAVLEAGPQNSNAPFPTPKAVLKPTPKVTSKPTAKTTPKAAPNTGSKPVSEEAPPTKVPTTTPKAVPRSASKATLKAAGVSAPTAALKGAPKAASAGAPLKLASGEGSKAISSNVPAPTPKSVLKPRATAKGTPKAKPDAVVKQNPSAAPGAALKPTPGTPKTSSKATPTASKRGALSKPLPANSTGNPNISRVVKRRRDGEDPPATVAKKDVPLSKKAKVTES